MHFKKILVTTDFSDDSYQAFDYAAYQGKMEGSKVVLATVIEDWEVPEVLLREIPNPESITAYRRELNEKAVEKLEELVEERFHGQEVETAVIRCDKGAGHDVCAWAKDQDVDLIVMASHGRGAIGNLLLGSVAQKIIRFAPCPVMVIPRPAE